MTNSINLISYGLANKQQTNTTSATLLELLSINTKQETSKRQDIQKTNPKNQVELIENTSAILWSITLYGERVLNEEGQRVLANLNKQQALVEEFDREWLEQWATALEHLTIYSLDNTIEKEWFQTNYYLQRNAIIDRICKARKNTIQMTDWSDNNSDIIAQENRKLDKATRKALTVKLVQWKKELEAIDANNTIAPRTKRLHKARIRNKVQLVKHWDYVV